MVDVPLPNTKTISELRFELKQLLNQKKDIHFAFKKINFTEKKIL
jgi:hypothetical protein